MELQPNYSTYAQNPANTPIPSRPHRDPTRPVWDYDLDPRDRAQELQSLVTHAMHTAIANPIRHKQPFIANHLVESPVDSDLEDAVPTYRHSDTDIPLRSRSHP